MQSWPASAWGGELELAGASTAAQAAQLAAENRALRSQLALMEQRLLLVQPKQQLGAWSAAEVAVREATAACARSVDELRRAADQAQDALLGCLGAVSALAALGAHHERQPASWACAAAAPDAAALAPGSALGAHYGHAAPAYAWAAVGAASATPGPPLGELLTPGPGAYAGAAHGGLGGLARRGCDPAASLPSAPRGTPEPARLLDGAQLSELLGQQSALPESAACPGDWSALAAVDHAFTRALAADGLLLPDDLFERELALGVEGGAATAAAPAAPATPDSDGPAGGAATPPAPQRPAKRQRPAASDDCSAADDGASAGSADGGAAPCRDRMMVDSLSALLAQASSKSMRARLRALIKQRSAQAAAC
ncbi:hypothetical protein HT031_003833 [Scenedesmus sp. PABB004]|nr:hypothetical protein HT031_003833 [Scenedesmus sp. PABB004]